MNVLTVDPATKRAGYGIFQIDPAAKCGYLLESGAVECVKGEWLERMDNIVDRLMKKVVEWECDRLVSEAPELFGTTAGKGAAASNSGAVMKLQAMVYSLRSRMLTWADGDSESVMLVPVRTWKGTVPKAVTEKRIRTHWGWDGSSNDESDAVGVGDWYVRKHLKYRAVHT